MTARILDGKAIAGAVREDVAQGVARFKKEFGTVPGFTAVLVGEDAASQVYVRSKERGAKEVGMAGDTLRLPDSTTETELLAEIARLNRDGRVHAILVQLPLPPHIRESSVLEAVDPRKDVDGFHPVNQGRLLAGSPRFVPATPAGIIEMLARAGIETAGKRAVIIGRSNIVGKPLAALLMQKGRGGDATVTVAHSRTRDVAALAREADILIAAIGRPRFVTADFVKPGATVIDVGINRVDDRLVGDVDFDAVKEIAGAITPVPGGVGPMTIAMVLANALRAAELIASEDA